VFDAAAGGVIFHAVTGLDATAIAEVQAQVRRRLLSLFVRRGLLPADDAQGMTQWEHGGRFLMRRCASRPLTVPDVSGCCAIAPARRLPWTGCANSIPSVCSTRARSPVLRCRHRHRCLGALARTAAQRRFGRQGLTVG
jgi:hypothetical protein